MNENNVENDAGMTDAAIRAMISPWLIGDTEADAGMLKRTFRTLGFSLTQWRQVVSETEEAR